MKTLKFKTNINCGGCIANVTPVLDKLAGPGNWETDTKSPQKVLTIHSDNLSAAEIIEGLKAIGYNATELA